jgi:hypothetical protein
MVRHFEAVTAGCDCESNDEGEARGADAMATKRGAVLSFRISEAVKRGIDKAAAEDRRSTAAFVSNLLEDFLKAKAKPAGRKVAAEEGLGPTAE